MWKNVFSDSNKSHGMHVIRSTCFHFFVTHYSRPILLLDYTAEDELIVTNACDV